jgi:Ca-activated chloride channel family protein
LRFREACEAACGWIGGTMHYAYPHLIPVSLLAGGALAGLLALAWLRRRRALRRLAEAPTAEPLLLVSRPRQAARLLLFLAAAVLLAVALLGPQWGQISDDTPADPSPGRDVLIVLDVSRSMLAEDVTPSRLARAKADVRDLVAALQRQGGYRVGLIAFADRAALLCPLTADFRCFDEELSRASLEALRLRGDNRAEEGTAIGLALQRAARAINKQAAAYTDILLISDGGDMEQDTLAAADELKQLGVAVNAVGLGDPARGALIPITGRDGRRSFLEYKGEPVRVRLEEDVLRRIAERTGGEYVGVGTGFVELDRWFGALVAGKVVRELESSAHGPTFVHRFQLFLLPALALLLLEALLRDAPRTAGAAPRTGYFTWLSLRPRRKPLTASAEEKGSRS